MSTEQKIGTALGTAVGGLIEFGVLLLIMHLYDFQVAALFGLTSIGMELVRIRIVVEGDD